MKHTTLLLAALLLTAIFPVSHSARASAPGANELNVRAGLPNAAEKINRKQNVRVAFLGGSITAANGWRVHTLEILRRAFPNAKFTEIFAAVSGTGSNYGACRLERDVLEKNPDLLFVEFAVNDGGVAPALIEAQMEGIVRQVRTRSPDTDICFVYTLSEPQLPALQSGNYQQSAIAMEKVAAHYGIPTIHFGVEVARRVAANTLVFSAPASVKADANGNDSEGRIIFTRDKTHPTGAGHRVYAVTLERTLPALLKTGFPAAAPLPSPLRADNWTRAKLIIPADAAKSGAWKKLSATDVVTRHAGQMAPPVWSTFKPGASIEFSFKGTRFGIIGLKGAENGKFRCTIDGKIVETGTLFDAFSTPGRHPLKPWFVPRPLEDTEHHVRIELLDEKIDKAAIMKKPGLSDAAYEQHGLYLCGLLFVGEPLSPPVLK
ncbi:SGNH/GDSL hydrolase family protein [Ereboglobus luteus]|uniref:SGNH hydrolase-type esterase domain-containing protein n=1 Tax=Ereboglobus luteus TaxID=1796921 RepID=A0A2U8E3K7_9BACT|nr:SGNH/GDSL hydrolase family protein [Ereboglobus luteus]AWI09463.1 hypothetical protein CKA38_09580 [Ereboglobus luteus]